MKSKSGGGITSKNVMNVGIRAGLPAKNLTSPAAASQLGTSTAYKKETVDASMKSQSPLGNSLATNIGKGGPGAGRDVMALWITARNKESVMNTELEDLKKRMTELENQIDPAPRATSTHPAYDPTEGFSMPANVIAEMASAVPDRLVQDVVNDLRRGIPASSSMTAKPNEAPVKRGTGWQERRPLRPPEGVNLCDRLIDQQDQLDKRDLAKRLAGL